MFNSKKISLFENKTASAVGKSTMTVPTNKFVRSAFKSSVTTNAYGNGAKKLTTTGSVFVDQFGSITSYKAPRSYSEVDKSMTELWQQNKALTIALVFYIRMITRVVSLFNGVRTTTAQRGQGLKHEGIFRMIWLHVNAPKTFWKNIVLFISVGSWKDIITMLSYDLQWHGWKDRVLDWNKFGALILAGLENPNTSELLKKYLPQIKANKQCTTVESQADNMIAKWICSLIYGGKTNEDSYKNYKSYRKLKSSGTAHQWQQLISQHDMLKINFDTIHGRALAQLVSGKFLKNQGLEFAYESWISTKAIAKYTGYVYELLAPVKVGYTNSPLKTYQISTINAQFMGLIETAKKGMKDDDAGLLVVVDTSSSMTGMVPSTKVSAYSVAKAMALYFSYLLKGTFENSWMEFADGAKLHYWKGNTPVEKLQNDKSEAYGSTNFQSVANTFVKMKTKQNIPESDFPSGILCLSDGLFNSTRNNKSNFTVLLDTLRMGGFSEEYVNKFKVVLWDVPNNSYGTTPSLFEDFADTPNLFHMSGLDGSVVAFITGVDHQKALPKTSEELFLAAMDQECLHMLEV